MSVPHDSDRPGGVRVSVVIPTYCSGPRLDEALASVDAQTLPAERIEVLLVDDGSPDGTPERVTELARSRPLTRAILLEHSGWPSRPRNAGLEAAAGDYVVFMDHDDELYPGGLEAAVAMADRTGADVVTAKESRTDQPKWALEVFTRNFDDASERDDAVHPLRPTNPHKLFRRSFLLEHDVRFPEGQRVMWEDIFFSIDLAAAGARTAILADVPFYHWVRHGSTASTTYSADRPEWWYWLGEIFAAIDDRLEQGSRDHQTLQLHQHRARLLGGLNAPLLSMPDAERAPILALATTMLERVDPSMDEQLPRHLAARAALARAGEWDLLLDLLAVDGGLVGTAEVTDVRWDTDGQLVVSFTTTWTTDAGGLALRQEGDRVLRVLPEHLAGRVPAELLDVTDDLAAATTTLAVRSRDDAVTWEVPTEQRVEVTGEDGELVVRLRGKARIDPATAALGRPLAAGVWDLSARAELFGVLNHRPLRTAAPPRVALVDGESRVAYKNDSKGLTIDLGQTKRTVLGSAKVRPSAATTEHRRFGADGYRLPLPSVSVHGRTRIEGGVVLQPVDPQPATLVADGDGARIEGDLDAPPGEYRIIGNFGGRDVELDTVVRVDRGGRLTFTEPRPR
ncbi:glycosyltransferase family 2 protein [Isoptericola cucumis]|uniref:Minor teichoic acids biosynthesis protein GgaB n=1 Tax=Isoptericola cucumis TaxID=1776856 RepID=A0ABQ2B7U9_9MICO|nr:glycosyltransferase family 2 protein [Isoptericola cucumis]GGI09864.1 minor teichoic acids biosynthesis protein GgaB [Isoptericola cucumis]